MELPVVEKKPQLPRVPDTEEEGRKRTPTNCLGRFRHLASEGGGRKQVLGAESFSICLPAWPTSRGTEWDCYSQLFQKYSEGLLLSAVPETQCGFAKVHAPVHRGPLHHWGLQLKCRSSVRGLLTHSMHCIADTETLAHYCLSLSLFGNHSTYSVHCQGYYLNYPYLHS